LLISEKQETFWVSSLTRQVLIEKHWAEQFVPNSIKARKFCRIIQDCLNCKSEIHLPSILSIIKALSFPILLSIETIFLVQHFFNLFVRVQKMDLFFKVEFSSRAVMQ
jgi:hypothetical protein